MRIKDLPLAQSLTGDEFLAVDDATSGTKKASIDDVLSGIQETLDSLPEDDDFVSALITERTLDSSVSTLDQLMVVDPLTGDVSKKTLATLTSLQDAKHSAYHPLMINIATFSSLPHTVSSSDIKVDMVVLNSWLSNPEAQTSEWTVTTSDGALVVSGSISGNTQLILILGKADV